MDENFSCWWSSWFGGWRHGGRTIRTDAVIERVQGIGVKAVYNCVGTLMARGRVCDKTNSMLACLHAVRGRLRDSKLGICRLRRAALPHRLARALY